MTPFWVALFLAFWSSATPRKAPCWNLLARLPVPSTAGWFPLASFGGVPSNSMTASFILSRMARITLTSSINDTYLRNSCSYCLNSNGALSGKWLGTTLSYSGANRWTVGCSTATAFSESESFARISAIKITPPSIAFLPMSSCLLTMSPNSLAFLSASCFLSFIISMFTSLISVVSWSCLFCSLSISVLFLLNSSFIVSTSLTLFRIFLWLFMASSVFLSTVKMPLLLAVSTLACTLSISSLASSEVRVLFFLRTSTTSPPRFWAPMALALTVTGSEMSNLPAAIDSIMLVSPMWQTIPGSPHIVWLSWMTGPPLAFLLFLLPSATSGSEASFVELFDFLRYNLGLLQNFVPSGIPNSANAPFLYLMICFSPGMVLMAKTSVTTLFKGSMSTPTFHWTLFMTVDLATNSGSISQNSLKNLTPPVARSNGDWRTTDTTARMMALRQSVLSSLLYNM